MTWNDLKFSDKMFFINKWSVVIVLANILEIIGALFFIFLKGGHGGSIDFIMGFGCMLQWISFVKYFDLNKTGMRFLSHTIRHSMPIVFKALLSAMPIMIGFAFLGMSLFWDSGRFSSA
jgi:hypothetical protein